MKKSTSMQHLFQTDQVKSNKYIPSFSKSPKPTVSPRLIYEPPQTKNSSDKKVDKNEDSTTIIQNRAKRAITDNINTNDSISKYQIQQKSWLDGYNAWKKSKEDQQISSDKELKNIKNSPPYIAYQPRSKNTTIEEDKNQLSSKRINYIQAPNRVVAGNPQMQKQAELHKLLFDKAMEISILEEKCKKIPLLQQKCQNFAMLQERCKSLAKELITANQSNADLLKATKMHQQEILNLQKSLKREKQENQALELEIKKLQIVNDSNRKALQNSKQKIQEILNENFVLKQNLSTVDQQHSRIFNVMKEKKVKEVQEIFNSYEEQIARLRQCNSQFYSFRWEIMEDLKQRCEFLENIFEGIGKNQNQGFSQEKLINIGRKAIFYWQKYSDHSIMKSQNMENESFHLHASMLDNQE